ncbi:glucosamine-6-phosphate deaminase [Mycoplasmopsis mustelae]|uniref:Glucosamine-6-phosphate deaminase n=1 Tax=Mycoplasmopsis mustelae TaxID=171289 RepID=A0A4R7UCM5_9BACT|nr:glucosamine-6-phosphate deaminase [Mycoplasmopsis mustelae]TDV22704.1 glucosamine-6-phosphate deaminase [Mycoplasmopsis mustelae]
MKIIIKENAEQQALYASDMIAKEIKENPNLNICFATGNSPIKTYQLLIKKFQNNEISFAKVTSFNLDEYVGIKKSNPCSYHYFMHQQLFNHINIKKENINLPNGLGNITKNAIEYESLILAKGGIDLMILGIGVNGHIAFNEPGSKIDDITREVQLTHSTIETNKKYFTNKNAVPKNAISMGIGTILKAKKIILLADGINKADAILKAIKGKITSDVPASFLQTHKDVTFILDAQAAKLL